jgi:hypothetical protein
VFFDKKHEKHYKKFLQYIYSSIISCIIPLV